MSIKSTTNTQSNNPTMEELLASQTKKLINLNRGQQVEGKVIQVSEKEIILDLGAKSEGVLPLRGSEGAKVGDKLKVFVVQTESDSGQVILSLQKSFGLGRDRQDSRKGGRFSERGNWNKFIQAKVQASKLSGTVLEINKGGLIVEVEGVRGFLPNSQVGFELLSKSGEGPLRQSDSEASLDKLIGQNLNLTVIEVDSNNNKLIFSQRGQVSEEVKNKLKQFKISQKVKGAIVAVLPFGLVVDVSGVEGLVFISDVSWEKIEDLSREFSSGKEVEVVVTGIDESFGRLNLSIKQLHIDPFVKLSEKYTPDSSVKAEVVSVTESGVVFKLEEGIEGLLPVAKMETGLTYETGKKMTVLIDSVDIQRRKITLAPFITSTEGLIYK